MQMTTAIPPEIIMLSTMETRPGTLKFFDGFPDAATVQKVYDNLDFMRAVDMFVNCVPGASLVALRAGARETGAVDGTVAIFETLMDQRSIFLTGNTESIYASTWLNLEEGPIVFESPPNVLGVVDDFCFPYVAYLGNAEPDKGWFVILRLSSPLEPFFDKTWRIGEVEEVR
jgi:hypothetical protein